MMPPTDLPTYNPAGMAADWGRVWSGHEAQGRQGSAGLGLGWSHPYDWRIEQGADWDAVLRNPNGERETFSPSLGADGFPSGIVRENTGNEWYSSQLLECALASEPGVPYKMVGWFRKWTYSTDEGAVSEGVWEKVNVLEEDGTQREFGKYSILGVLLSKETNPLGQSLVMRYSEQEYDSGQLSQVVDSLGRPLLSLTYDSNTGALTSARDAYGRQVFYTYTNLPGYEEPLLQSVSMKNDSGRYRHFYTYVAGEDEFGEVVPLLTSTTVPHPNNPGGTSTSQTFYDSEGRVGRKQDANGNSNVFLYGDRSTQVVVRNSQNVVEGTWTHNLDTEGRDVGTTDALGNTSRIIYHPVLPHEVASVTDATQRTTSFTYDAQGNLTSTTTPRGVRTQFTYNYSAWPFGRLMKTQTFSPSGEALPASEINYYEPSGLIRSTTNPHPSGVGFVTRSFTYNALGSIATVTEPDSSGGTRTTTYNYAQDGDFLATPAKDRPLVVTDSLGNSTRFRYDRFYNPISVRDALGHETRMAYNVEGQVTQVALPATAQTGGGQSQIRYAYTYRGGPLKRTQIFDESGNLERTVHRLLGAEGELRAISGDTLATSYQYDSLYRLKAFRDGNNNRTTYFYDAAGRLIEERYPLASAPDASDRVRYPLHDAAGRVLRKIDGRGVVTNYLYDDPDGALTRISYPTSASENVALFYDEFGRLERRRDASGFQITTYTPAQTVQSTTTRYLKANGTFLSNYTLTPIYNPDGSVAQLRTPSGTLSYSYDSESRLTGLQTPTGAVASWSYLANDWLETQQLPTGHRTHFAYNAQGQVVASRNTTATGDILSQWGDPAVAVQQILHNASGQRLSLPSLSTPHTAFGGTTNHTYSTRGQLIREVTTRGLGADWSYGFDGAGNPTSWRGTARTFNANNQETTGGPLAFSYDGAGNATRWSGKHMVSTPSQTQGAPNLVSEEPNGLAMSYTAQGQMAQVNALESDGSVGALKQKNGYRSDGLRAWKEDTSGNRTYFYYNGTTLVGTLSESASGTLSPLRQLLWGADGLLGLRWQEESGEQKASYFLWDTQGNLSQNVSESGVMGRSFGFTAYGSPLPDGSGELAQATFGYGGKFGYFRDGETGLVLCTWRFYDPSLGTWTQRDPIGYDGGQNLYGYVSGDPVNATDPLGLAQVEVRFSPVGFMNQFHAYILVRETGGKTSWVVHAFPQYNPNIGQVGATVPLAAYQTLRKEFSLPLRQPAGTYYGRLDPFIRQWGDPRNPERGKNCPSYYIVASDSSKSAAFYLNKMRPIVDKILNSDIPYDPLTTNSNSFVAEVLEASGLDPFARVRKVKGVPGWKNPLF